MRQDYDNSIKTDDENMLPLKLIKFKTKIRADYRIQIPKKIVANSDIDLKQEIIVIIKQENSSTLENKSEES